MALWGSGVRIPSAPPAFRFGKDILLLLFTLRSDSAVTALLGFAAAVAGAGIVAVDFGWSDVGFGFGLLGSERFGIGRYGVSGITRNWRNYGAFLGVRRWNDGRLRLS